MKILKIIGGLILVLLVIFLAAGIFVPQVTYQTSITVNKPLAETFELFNDIDKIQKWIPEVQSVEPIKETPDKIGSQYKMKIVSEGNEVVMTEEVIAYEVNKLVTLDFDAGDMHKIDSYKFDVDGNNTVINADHICEGSNYIMKCVFAFFKSMFRDIDQGYMENFKSFAEA